MISLRRVTEAADLPEIAKIHRETLPITYSAGFYKRLLGRNCMSLVAEVDGMTAGVITCRLAAANDPEDPQPLSLEAYIMTLAVLPKHRSNGLGTLLLKTLICYLEALYSESLQSIALHVKTDNRRAARLYGRCGFVVAGVDRQYYTIDGRPWDAFKMTRVRRSSASQKGSTESASKALSAESIKA